MQKLSQQQRMLQRLSPQQIQLMRLLQVPTLNLEEAIKEEIEENPALEFATEDSVDDNLNFEDDKPKDESDDYLDGNDDRDDFEKIELTDYVNEADDHDADYNFQDNYGQSDDKSDRNPIRVENSLHEHLMQQLHMLNLEAKDEVIAEQTIGSIDDEGYLRRDTSALVDDLSFIRNIQVDEKYVIDILKQIQQFEPPGVGARNLQECLLLQLDRKEDKTNDLVLANKILNKFFDEFTKKHYDKIKKVLKIEDEDLKGAINCIIKLNPRPGNIFEADNKVEKYILPDFFLNNNNGVLEPSLNSKNAPELRISSEYREMFKQYDKSDKKNRSQRDAVFFIKQKIDAAKWFIDAIKQRQQTLMITINEIIALQREFFLTGDETNLKPMILKDVAEKTGYDISTISRVANSKYIQTEFGTFKLKFFFSESLSTDSGEEVSAREVKKILSNYIEKEDKLKPFSDDVLAELLNEQGYNIARRTVAKYREQLNIPVARLRKEL